MLRRKRKSPKAGGREPQAPRVAHAAHETPAPRTRRRARPDAVVPEALRLKATPSPEPSRERSLRPAPSPRPAPAAAAAEPPPAPRAPQPSARKRAAEGVILVTGFEPFGGEAVNPSWEVCKRLPREIAGRRVETCRVPCEFRTAIEVVAEAIERLQPEMVVSVGQAGGRVQLGVERVAINVDDARAPDNAGQQPIDEPVAENGPPAYFSTLPVKAMVAAMRRAGVPAELSNTAGTYVCNHLMYGVLHFLAASGKAATRAGFIHVPYSEEQALDKPGTASMSLAGMARGIEAAITAACETRLDVRTAEGTLD